MHDERLTEEQTEKCTSFLFNTALALVRWGLAWKNIFATYREQIYQKSRLDSTKHR
jgi:hypothetical protein